MRRIGVLVPAFAALLLSVSSASAEIRIEIISMPSEVFSFEPAWVLFSVENRGDKPELLPDSYCPPFGFGLYVARRGEPPRPLRGFHVFLSTTYAQDSIWLAPGEKWLFYENMVMHLDALDGEFDFQAVASSTGRCSGAVSGGRHSFPLSTLESEVDRSLSSPVRVYHCWKGEARSEIRHIRVRHSENPVDRSAEDFLKASRAIEPRNDGTSWVMQHGWRALKDFPTSHYSYAAIANDSTSAASMLQAVELQPGNPLNPWVNGAIARRVLDYRSSCWSGQKIEWDIAIDKLELPPGVREYLDQYAWTLENRTCPLERERLAKEKARKAAAPGRR